MWIAGIVVVTLLGLAYWELIVCEGAHLGRHFVVWLYDLTASHYERIKGFDPDWERRWIGEPLFNTVRGLRGARLLDVGAGTGRAARALHNVILGETSIVNVEPSRKMLSLGKQHPAADGSTWVQAWAEPLPFPASSFDAVVSLEVLEFTPDPQAALAEFARVLRPGAWLLVTNRIGSNARWIFRRTFRREAFGSVLESAGFSEVEVFPWQVEYDLAWARKPHPYPSSDQEALNANPTFQTGREI
ncbi:MAG TPA: class I SAM-dependent methyltransferase [Anaerolineales bacterium]|nr:class I SAM-dependent methyltransferase [Anaerolineales bacterium]